MPPAGFGAEPREEKIHLRPLTDNISNSTAPHKHTNTAQATEREPHTGHTQTDSDRESNREAVRTV